MDAEQIFFKEKESGAVYLLKYRRTQKRHSYMETKVAEFDKCLMSLANNQMTWFVSIGEDERSCKVRSFGRGEWRRDPLFLEIFDVESPKIDGEYQTREGVKMWSMQLQKEAEEARDHAREAEDIAVQESVMEADPEAFGGGAAVASFSGSKTSEKTEFLQSQVDALTTEVVQLRREIGELNIVRANLAVAQTELDVVRKQKAALVADSDAIVAERLKEACGDNGELAALRIKVSRYSMKARMSKEHADSQTEAKKRLGERLLEHETMGKELAVLRAKSAEVKEMERWCQERQRFFASEIARVQRIVAGQERLDRDEELAALHAENLRVRAESEANASGLVTVKERDVRIGELAREIEHLNQKLANANAEAEKALQREGVMHDVVVEFGNSAVREEIRKRVKGVYYAAREMWEGKFFEGEDGGEAEDSVGGGKRKKQRKEKSSGRV